MSPLRGVSLRGVVVDLSGLRDRGPGFKTRSRPLTLSRIPADIDGAEIEGVHILLAIINTKLLKKI